MKTRDYCFNLPEHLIAQAPADKRSESRLMVLNRREKTITHALMSSIDTYIPNKSCMVVNNSKVRKARMYGTLDSGIGIETLFLEETEPGIWTIMSNKTRRLKEGRTIYFPGGVTGTVIESRKGSDRKIRLSEDNGELFFSKYGHVPLPPYIQREDNSFDSERYQTVYAEKIGSVAAPTAGLHFTEPILNKIRSGGTDIIPVTLHVGAGTFLPIRSENLADHVMHYESYEIETRNAEKINNAKTSGRKVLAVGTTSVRTLEAAAEDTGLVRPGVGRTNLFIMPGYKFNIVDHLLTNFHTPESTLLVLVSAFAGHEFIMKAYDEAVREEYRFFSYGDAMLIL